MVAHNLVVSTWYHNRSLAITNVSCMLELRIQSDNVRIAQSKMLCNHFTAYGGFNHDHGPFMFRRCQCQYDVTPTFTPAGDFKCSTSMVRVKNEFPCLVDMLHGLCMVVLLEDVLCIHDGHGHVTY